MIPAPAGRMVDCPSVFHTEGLARPWRRLPEPIMTVHDADARSKERQTLFWSSAISASEEAP